MSVDRQYGKVVFTCDECGDDLETGEGDFLAALQFMKEEGWQTVRNADDTEWVHICNECDKDGVLRKRKGE